MKNSMAVKLERGSEAILSSAGVFSQPGPNRRAAGVSRKGENVFVETNIASSSDLNTGAILLHSLAAFVSAFNVFSKKEWETVKYVEGVSKNTKLISALDKEHEARQSETFIATIMKAARSDTRHALGAYSSLKIYDHWGVMSPAQKSVVIAALAIQTHNTDKGGPVCDLKIIDGPDGQVLKVRDALELFSIGKNPFSLAQFWEQIKHLHMVYGGPSTPEALSDFAESHGLIGKGAKDAAVPGVTKQDIEAGGAKPAPQYGVGALAAPPQSKTPQGYVKAASMPGGDIVVPQANANTAAGALQGSLVGTKAGADGVSQDAVSVYKKWKKEDAKGIDKGAEGGSAFIAGLTSLKQKSPQLYSALIAFITHFANKKVLSSTATEYFATLSGIALARLVTGKKEDKADSEGAALAQAAHADSPADFAKLQIKIRALYANFGVSSRADAYQLTNQAYAENRIDESDLIAMHEIFDIVFLENGLARIQRLMYGKDKGLEIARNDWEVATNTLTAHQGEQHKAVLKEMTKEALRKRNAAKYAVQQQQAPEQEAAEPSAQQGPEEESSENTQEAPQGAETPSLPPQPSQSVQPGA